MSRCQNFKVLRSRQYFLGPPSLSLKILVLPIAMNYCSCQLVNYWQPCHSQACTVTVVTVLHISRSPMAKFQDAKTQKSSYTRTHCNHMGWGIKPWQCWQYVTLQHRCSNNNNASQKHQTMLVSKYLQLLFRIVNYKILQTFRTC